MSGLQTSKLSTVFTDLMANGGGCGDCVAAVLDDRQPGVDVVTPQFWVAACTYRQSLARTLLNAQFTNLEGTIFEGRIYTLHGAIQWQPEPGI